MPHESPSDRAPAPGVTRLAPSPTGALHLGNARTFLINWLLARQNHWRIVLRIEDLDGPRLKPGADTQAIEDLRWLGIDWDEGPSYQSARSDAYNRALRILTDRGDVYPCVCTRREVELAASAPHADDGASVYPGACRKRFASVLDAFAQTGRAPALRMLVPNEPVEFDDLFAGHIEYPQPASQLGDFVIRKADGTFAYQLAVVADDADAGVTHVVRGDDLLDSTPRQIVLYRALGLTERIPCYTHLPLVLGPDGRRLAKRHGDTRLASYRTAGVTAARVRALLARWCGIDSPDDELPTESMLQAFDLGRVPRQPITFTAADDALLRTRGGVSA